VRSPIAAVFIAGIFGAGVFVGSIFLSNPSYESPVKPALEAKVGSKPVALESLRLTQSTAISSDGSGPSIAENLSDPRVRSTLEKNLREVPYAVLKQIYLERQDETWARQQERYIQPKEMTDAELDQRASRLFDAFQRSSEKSNYVARGEWKLRGGKSLPYVALVEYYSTRSEADASGPVPASSSANATNGRELCYSSTLYFRIGDRYAADGQSNCLSWVAIRQDHPFAVHANYNSKRLVPFFDSVSVPLPGFGSDGDASGEWYDLSSNRWSSVGRVRFDPVSKDEFESISKETQLETDGE